jgi:hypothetical protein
VEAINLAGGRKVFGKRGLLPEMLFLHFCPIMQHFNHKSARGVKFSEEIFSLTVNAPNSIF